MCFAHAVGADKDMNVGRRVRVRVDIEGKSDGLDALRRRLRTGILELVAPEPCTAAREAVKLPLNCDTGYRTEK